MIGPARRKPLVSTSPQATRAYREESSPTKASILLRSDCSEYVNGLKAKKENYTTALGLYTACYDHELPQKCLKHLNFVTLYCADEHKLLCVNCLYGSTAHKNHSVTPSNSSLSSIRIDNEENLRSLDDEIKEIREAEVMVNENKRIVESESHYIIEEIAKDFKEMRRMIDMKEKEIKERAAVEFDRASIENEITRREIGWWREEMQKMRNGLPRDGKAEDAEIYKHLVLELMLNEKLETEKLTYVASKDEMEHEFLTEARELREVVKSKVSEGSLGNQIRLF